MRKLVVAFLCLVFSSHGKRLATQRKDLAPPDGVDYTVEEHSRAFNNVAALLTTPQVSSAFQALGVAGAHARVSRGDTHSIRLNLWNDALVVPPLEEQNLPKRPRTIIVKQENNFGGAKWSPVLSGSQVVVEAPTVKTKVAVSPTLPPDIAAVLRPDPVEETTVPDVAPTSSVDDATPKAAPDVTPASRREAAIPATAPDVQQIDGDDLLAAFRAKLTPNGIFEGGAQAEELASRPAPLHPRLAQPTANNKPRAFEPPVHESTLLLVRLNFDGRLRQIILRGDPTFEELLAKTRELYDAPGRDLRFSVHGVQVHPGSSLVGMSKPMTRATKRIVVAQHEYLEDWDAHREMEVRVTPPALLGR